MLLCFEEEIVHNVAVKYEVRCKKFFVLSNSEYSTEYEVKDKHGRMLLISFSYTSSNLDVWGLEWLAGFPAVLQELLGTIWSLHRDVWDFYGSSHK